MSTKIYDAYRFPRGIELMAFQERARQLANPVRDRLDAAEIVNRATVLAVHDAFFVSHKRDEGGVDLLAKASPAAQACHDYSGEQRKENPRSTFHDPHRFELSLVAHGSYLGVKTFTSRRDYGPVMEQLCQEFGGQEFHYQNQSDQPDDVTDSEWEERRKFWDAAVGDAPWNERGLSFVLRGEMSLAMIFPDEIRQAAEPSMVPTRNAITAMVARNLVSRAAGKQRTIDNMFSFHDVSKYPELLLHLVEASLPVVTLDTLFEPLPRPGVPLATDDMRQLAALTADRILDGGS